MAGPMMGMRRGGGPGRRRRGHGLGERGGAAHNTAPGPASRVRMPRTACALVCSSTRARLLSLTGLNVGVGVAQVVRGAAELHGVEGAVVPARVKRVGRRVGGAKSCRRRSPSCLGGADSPSSGLRASGHLGIKLPPESMTQGIGGAFSSGCILVGAAIVPAPGISCPSTCPVPAACQLGFWPHPTDPSVGEGTECRARSLILALGSLHPTQTVAPEPLECNAHLPNHPA